MATRMTKIDPWADVRGIIGNDPELDMEPRNIVRALLADADALLVVVSEGISQAELKHSMGDSYGHLTEFMKLVAALPEHIRK